MDAVSALLAAIEAGRPDEVDVFTPDAVFDATVPNWRFSVRGADRVRSQLSSWYRHPGRLEDLQRSPLEDGEFVQFVLTWEEDGTPFAAHQAHRIRLRDGRIDGDTVWCGGRWSAGLLAEMEEAGRANG